MNMATDPHLEALLARCRKDADFPRKHFTGSERYDLALVTRGFPIGMVKSLTAELIAFARRPSIHPMGELTGGAGLGFDATVLQAMQDRWGITQADIDAVNDGLGWTE